MTEIKGHAEFAKEIAPVDELTEMLEGMTKPELVRYARLTYGLSVTAKLNKHDLIAAIKKAASQFTMNAEFSSETEIKDNGLKPGYAEIQLHRNDTMKGLKSAIVGLNGKFASLPIGQRFGCPIELVAVLENAVRLEYEQDPETNELVERTVHSYPYTIFDLKEHTPESLAASKRKRGLKIGKNY